jgi:hypothetical protein
LFPYLNLYSGSHGANAAIFLPNLNNDTAIFVSKSEPVSHSVGHMALYR